MKSLVLVAALGVFAALPVRAGTAYTDCVSYLEDEKQTVQMVDLDLTGRIITFGAGPVADAAQKAMTEYDANMRVLIAAITKVCKAAN